MLVHAEEVRTGRVAGCRHGVWQIVQTELLTRHQNGRTGSRFDVINECGGLCGHIGCHIAIHEEDGTLRDVLRIVCF